MALNRAFALALSWVALCALGCGTSSDAQTNQVVPGQALSVPSTDGLAVGTVQLEGDQVTRGRNSFLVAFDPSTTEISAASTLMPVHGHGSITPTLTRESAGYRVSDVVFNMPGLWEVRLDITVSGKADHLIWSADAP